MKRERESPAPWWSLLLSGWALLVIVATLRPYRGPGEPVLAFAIGLATLYPAYRIFERGERTKADLRRSEASRRVAETESASQRAAIDGFADGLEVAIVICDDRARVAYANRTAREMFGTAEPIGRALLAMTLSPEIEAVVEESGRNGTSIAREILFHRPTDRVALAKAWTPEPSAGRTFLSLIEITDLRRLERVRRDFVANVSHELRTPMTIIRAYAETLLDDDDEVLKARYLQKIISEVDRLTSISHDLLVLSAAENGTVREGSADLAEIVRGTVHGLEGQAIEKGLRIRYQGPDHLRIEANPAQIEQVAINLVENAVKYSREGEVRVALMRSEEGVELCVSDTGIGIGSEHIERIFERFYRVDKGRTRREGGIGGTGLGLAIVKHIVESHGGTISVESVLNAGSTFCVRLPVAATE